MVLSVGSAAPVEGTIRVWNGIPYPFKPLVACLAEVASLAMTRIVEPTLEPGAFVVEFVEFVAFVELLPTASFAELVKVVDDELVLLEDKVVRLVEVVLADEVVELVLVDELVVELVRLLVVVELVRAVVVGVREDVVVVVVVVDRLVVVVVVVRGVVLVVVVVVFLAVVPKMFPKLRVIPNNCLSSRLLLWS